MLPGFKHTYEAFSPENPKIHGFLAQIILHRTPLPESSRTTQDKTEIITPITLDGKIRISSIAACQINNSFFMAKRRDKVSFETYGFKEAVGTREIIVEYSGEAQLDVSRLSRITSPMSNVYQVIPNPIEHGNNIKLNCPTQPEKTAHISNNRFNRPKAPECRISDENRILNNEIYFT